MTANLQQHLHYAVPADLPNLQPAASSIVSAPDVHAGAQQSLLSHANRKRKSVSLAQFQDQMANASSSAGAPPIRASGIHIAETDAAGLQEPKAKKSRTNTPWTPAEELRLKQMRDTGNSWSEIAKVGRETTKTHGSKWGMTTDTRC